MATAPRTARQGAGKKAPRPSSETLHVTIPDTAWQATGETRGKKQARLYASLTINGVGFHGEAFEVRYLDDECRQACADENLDEAFERYHAVAGGEGPVETMTIGGREYAVFLSPFC